MNRRAFLAASALVLAAATAARASDEPRRILLRSSWQTVNIGDIAHTPGMLALLEKHRPGDAVTLWPKGLNADVERMLTGRFPKLAIARVVEIGKDAAAARDLAAKARGFAQERMAAMVREID